MFIGLSSGLAVGVGFLAVLSGILSSYFGHELFAGVFTEMAGIFLIGVGFMLQKAEDE